jgi:CRP/FNR family transcriptional regulator
LKQLTDIELELATANRVQLSFRKGETVAKQGAIVTHILFLKSGMAKIYKELHGKNNLILNIFPAGQLIGLPALYGNKTFGYSVAVIEDSVVCAIDKVIFERLIEQNGAFATEVINAINRCTQNNFEKIVSLTQKQLNGKMADAILFLKDQIYKADSFSMSLTRKDLAEFTGMSVMSVVRVLQSFKQEGIIDEQHGLLSVLKPERLVMISEKG